MSTKRNARNTNKSLKALKRKKVARGGRLEPREMKRNLIAPEAVKKAQPAVKKAQPAVNKPAGGVRRRRKEEFQVDGGTFRVAPTQTPPRGKAAEDIRFKAMPVEPTAYTQDMVQGSDPITGKPFSGGSSKYNYRKSLKQYFDKNEGAEAYYNSKQPKPQRNFTPSNKGSSTQLSQELKQEIPSAQQQTTREIQANTAAQQQATRAAQADYKAIQADTAARQQAAQTAIPQQVAQTATPQQAAQTATPQQAVAPQQAAIPQQAAQTAAPQKAVQDTINNNVVSQTTYTPPPQHTPTPVATPAVTPTYIPPTPTQPVTYTGLDGQEYSTNAALTSANAAYLAAQVNEDVNLGNGYGNYNPAEDGIGPGPGGIDRYVGYTPPATIVTPSTMSGVTVEGATSTGAPRGITFNAPETTLDQMVSKPILGEDGSAPAGTITGDAGIQKLGDATDATSGTVTAQPLTADQGDVTTADVELGDGVAETYEASTTAGQLAATRAAKGAVSKTGIAAQGTASTVDTAQRDRKAEAAALGIAAGRPVAQDYATAQTDDSDYSFDTSTVSDPSVTTSEGVTISDAKVAELTKLAVERNIDPEQAIKDFKDSIAFRTSQTGAAAQTTYTPRLGEAPEEAAARADTYGTDYTPQGGKTDIDAIPAYAKAAVSVAQVGEAKSRKAAELGNAPSVDLEGRQAISGEAPKGDASQIGGIPTAAAASMDAVTGQARKAAASDMLAVVADVSPEITAALVEDPATVEAQLDLGTDPQTVAAIAALPVEALVSTQMEGLLAGMEDGQTPAWARPAVAAIEAQMAQRGLSVSTVGRDALFNAIIQSALPMAQSNAQALQARAQQNLSNQQQANLSSAQNTMQVRLQNLANRQTSASQTASMANEIKKQKNSFEQQAVMTTAQQAQETTLTNAQMAQQQAQQESSQRQQVAISNLSTGAQMDLANLQALNAAGSQNMSAEQQSKLASYNSQIAKVMRQAELSQDMEKANLSNSLQVEMQRVSEINAAAKDTMTAEQTERLTNLSALIDFRKTDAQFAQQMDIANMTNEQQMELANLSERSRSDSANFTADNQFRMQELNNIVARSMRKAELDSRMEEVNLDAQLKVELSELSEKNTTSRANMTAEQQTRLANLNVLVDFRKTNAGMAQQMDVANLANEQQMELANLQDRSATDAANFTEINRGRLQELNTAVQVLSQNEQLKQNADMAKLSMQEKIELANLSSKSQADMASMSAENIAQLQVYEKKMQAGQVNAQLAQQMGLANLSNEQSAAMFNAQINANFDMSAMSNEQQMEIANSRFMQTMTATKFSADQQSAIQNATLLTQTDLANADARTRVSVDNAKNFLTMDMANLSNVQQGIVLDQQLEQQALLSDQAAQNAARQFGATSQNQLDSFLISQSNNMRQFNTQARNAMESFNVTETNRTAAIEAGNTLQADSLTAQLEADINKFNASIDNQRDTWNAANAQAIEQSNVSWRRQANTIDTAAANAANQQNVQNAYNISALDQTQMWQTLRDEAQYIRQSYETNEQREAQLLATAIGNESGAAYKASTSTSTLLTLLKKYGGI